MEDFLLGEFNLIGVMVDLVRLGRKKDILLRVAKPKSLKMILKCSMEKSFKSISMLLELETLSKFSAILNHNRSFSLTPDLLHDSMVKLLNQDQDSHLDMSQRV
jgi:hypothetical protein